MLHIYIFTRSGNMYDSEFGSAVEDSLLASDSEEITLSQTSVALWIRNISKM